MRTLLQPRRAITYTRIHGGSLKKWSRYLARMAKPVLTDFLRQFATHALPAIGSRAQDALNKKGLSSIGDVVASASVAGAKSASEGRVKQGETAQAISDFIADKALASTASKLNGSGPVQIGGSPARLGGGPVQIGGSPARLGGGPVGGSLLPRGYFKSLQKGSGGDNPFTVTTPNS